MLLFNYDFCWNKRKNLGSNNQRCGLLNCLMWVTIYALNGLLNEEQCPFYEPFVAHFF